MAIIKYSDLIEDDGAIDKLEKDIADLAKFINKTGKQLQGSLSTVSPDDDKRVKALVVELEKLKKAKKLLEDQKKKLSTTRKRANELSRQELIQLAQEREELRKNRAEAKAIARVKAAQAGSVEELRARLALVTMAWSKLRKSVKILQGDKD